MDNRLKSGTLYICSIFDCFYNFCIKQRGLFSHQFFARIDLSWPMSKLFSTLWCSYVQLSSGFKIYVW